MADELKITKNIIDKVRENFSKLATDEAARVGNMLGVDEELVNQVRTNPNSKQAVEFFKSILEKTKTGVKETGSLVNAAQALFDQAAGRAPRTPEAVFKAGEEAAAKVGGGAPSAFNPSEAKFVGEGGRQVVPEPMPFTLGAFNDGSPPGGPLTVPSRNRSLAKTAEILQNTTVDPVTGAPMSSETGLVPYSPRMERPVATAAEVSAAAAQAKPGQAGAGISELTPGAKILRGEESRIQAERAADFGLDIQGLPSAAAVEAGAKAVKAGKVGLGIMAGGAAAYGGYRLLDRAKLAPQDAEKLSVVNASGVDSTESLEQVTAQAEQQGALKPEQGQIIKDQVQQVKEVKETLEQMFARTEKKFEADKARLELFQAIDTIANGLASAIGSAALLNRGSPYAVDFSKGPQVNWDAQFDRLSKDFNSKIGVIKEKYRIEERRKEQEELRGYRQARLGLEAQKLEADKAKEAAAALAKRQEEVKKLNEKDQDTYQTNLKHYGDLRRAVEDKKAGAIADAAALLGADEPTLAKLKEVTNQGKFDKVLEFLGLSKEPSVEQVIQGLRPQKPVARPEPGAGDSAAPAAPAVQLPSAIITPDTPEGKETKRTTETDAQWKAIIDAVEAHWVKQGKSIRREY